nr:extracellular solute-binding protein [uncultured Cohaesibacter sp.]
MLLLSRRTTLAGLAATLIAASATTALAAPNEDAVLKDLYDKALAADETKVVVYNPNTNANKPIYDAFEKRFPKIEVTTVDLYGPKLTTRLEAESASGNVAADVLYTVPNAMESYADKDFLVSYSPELAEGIDEKYVGKDGKWTDWTMTVSGPFYNKVYVKAEDAPKSFSDLADPKWKKQVSTSSLQNISGTGQALTALTLAGKLDRAWFEKFAANEPIVSQANAQAIQAVASGQATVGIDVPLHFFKAAEAKGAPFGFIFPAEGVISIPLNAALIADAPRPEAAKLFINWLFSSECQELLAEIGMHSTMPDAPAVKGAPDGMDYNVMDWRTLINEYPAQLQMYKEVFSN